jgi:broad specificity phosphatase PhoE
MNTCKSTIRYYSLLLMIPLLIRRITTVAMSMKQPPHTTSSIQQLSSTSTTLSSKLSSTFKPKQLLFVRHGQATHNPRAEKAKENGCTHETFIKLMQEDDQFDSELTELGIQQAKDGRTLNQHRLVGVELVVSSPLSRALKTADYTICPVKGIDHLDDGDGDDNNDDNSHNHPKRICFEELREINGYLLNAKRRTKTQLQQLFHTKWDFNILSEEDETWTTTMETYDDCGERGYQSLLKLLQRTEDRILVVGHGGIFRFMMVDHPLVVVKDDRVGDDVRFKNCEMREYTISYNVNDDIGGSDDRPVVILTEV